MIKLVLAMTAAAALLTTAPLVTSAKAAGVKMAQGVDVQVGRDRDDLYDRDCRRRYDSDPQSARRRRWREHRPTTALPHGDYHDRTGRRPQDHAQGASLRLNGEQRK